MKRPKLSSEQIAVMVEKLRPGGFFFVGSNGERKLAMEASRYQRKPIVTKKRKTQGDFVVMATPP
jgi:hypothetical protein